MSEAKPKYSKRDAQLAEDWQWLNNTPQGRRIIADLMVWGDVYTRIEDTDPIAMALRVGESNLAKRVAYYLGWKADPYQFVQHAQDDTDLLNRFLSSQQH